MRGGASIDEMPLDVTIGPARVIEIKVADWIMPEELAGHNIQPGERILFKTINSSVAYQTDEFYKDYVTFSSEAVQFLANKKLRVVGVDYIAVGKGNDPRTIIAAHQTFWKSGTWIIEGLNLSGVEPGNYELICLPLRLEHGDACQARAIIRPT